MALKYEYSVVSGRFPTKQKAEDAISYIPRPILYRYKTRFTS